MDWFHENDQNIKKIVEEIFVYESTMVFGFVVLILTLNAFGVISIEDEGPIFLALFLFVGAHPFYFLLGLNKRLKITNIFVILFWGFIMSVVVSMTFLVAITIGGLAAGITFN